MLLTKIGADTNKKDSEILQNTVYPPGEVRFRRGDLWARPARPARPAAGARPRGWEAWPRRWSQGKSLSQQEGMLGATSRCSGYLSGVTFDGNHLPDRSQMSSGFW